MHPRPTAPAAVLERVDTGSGLSHGSACNCVERAERGAGFGALWNCCGSNGNGAAVGPVYAINLGLWPVDSCTDGFFHGRFNYWDSDGAECIRQVVRV